MNSSLTSRLGLLDDDWKYLVSCCLFSMENSRLPVSANQYYLDKTVTMY